ncbi:MAG: hypothetical protein K9W46_09780 [Candidatus Heimdallarchaeum endolithica]|uniref:DUF4350 domain-containing protein n=1 Tax=Candidatus Heimdallarchaeum endolithica TaxID=2876572 RepID=A0A9Y1FMQ9_9ARCH|nr:MAG: hypothetical protein K9W46_09780 [Candidatus Heimdallarchaeum endolithica]
MKFKTLAFLILIMTPFIMTTKGQFILAAPNTEKEYVILFDESHGQYFNSTLMKSALSAINDSLNVRFIFFNESKFNSTNLQGVDLVIIGNPGIYKNYNLSSEEVEVIQDYVEAGGSLFLLANPLSSDTNITGHVSSFNDILSARLSKLSSARFRTGLDKSSTVIMDDYHNKYNNESFLSIVNYNTSDNEFLEKNKIFEQTSKVENLTVYSTAISFDRPEKENAIGRTEITSYALEKDGSIVQDMINGFLVWLFAKEIGNARIVLSGSTIMFSDLLINENQKFINEDQNKELWLNLINWLLHITPYEEKNPIAMPFYSLVLLALGFAAVVFIIALLLYSYKKQKKINIKVK